MQQIISVYDSYAFPVWVKVLVTQRVTFGEPRLPLWVKTGSPAWASECPLLGVKQTSISGDWMSAFSQKEKSVLPDGCKEIQFPWRWDSGTITTNLDVISGMSVEQCGRGIFKCLATHTSFS